MKQSKEIKHGKEGLKNFDICCFVILAAITEVLFLERRLSTRLYRQPTLRFRSSCSQIFIEISVLKNFAIFTGKHLCWSLFLRNLQVLKPASLLKRDFNKVFSCGYCEIFKNNFSYRTPLVASSGD